MKKLVSPIFLLFLIPGAALAQRWEFSVSGSWTNLNKPSLGSLSTTDPHDNDTVLRGQYGYAARFTLNHHGYFGHELTYGISHAKFESSLTTTDSETEVSTTTVFRDRVRTQIGSYNFLLYMMPQGERFRPYITGGVHVMRWSAPRFPEWPGGGSRNMGANFGAGLKIKLFKHAQFRLDFRDYLSGNPYNQLELEQGTVLSPGRLRTLEGSAGIGITF